MQVGERRQGVGEEGGVRAFDHSKFKKDGQPAFLVHVYSSFMRMYTRSLKIDNGFSPSDRH